MKKGLRILFIVQGEGRGHITQSIALDEMLKNSNHEVVAVISGISPQRELPPFFRKHFGEKIIGIRSPNLLKDTKNKGVRMFLSLLFNLMISPIFIISIFRINRHIRHIKPDLIINFHELLCGFRKIFFRSSIPLVSIAHQYMYYHPRFDFPKISAFSRFSLKTVNYITTFGSALRVALNFSGEENYVGKSLMVAPPLLRQSIRESESVLSDHFLIYILNEGYREDIIAFHKKHPEIKLHCFTDAETLADKEIFSSNLTFHALDAEKYIHLLRSCKLLLSTAGFESVCEAMYLGKPVVIIPVRNHPEQKINAMEAKKTGKAFVAGNFDTDMILGAFDDFQADDTFKSFVDSAPDVFTKMTDSFSATTNS